MIAKIYVEGGGNTALLKSECREAFHELIEKLGISGLKRPRIVASGSRNETYDDFCLAVRQSSAGDYVAMVIDSEESVNNLNLPWAHLKQRDKWNRPAGTTDDQVFLMTTCMETWIVADREALKRFYKKLAENVLPPLHELESRQRHDVQECLERATKDCTNRYAKGRRSFQVLAVVDPTVLKQHLPSFERMAGILAKKLNS